MRAGIGRSQATSIGFRAFTGLTGLCLTASSASAESRIVSVLLTDAGPFVAAALLSALVVFFWALAVMRGLTRAELKSRRRVA